MGHPMQGYNPYEGSDEVPSMTPEESEAAAKNLAKVMEAKSEEESSEQTSLGTYGDTLVAQVLNNHPNLTPEKAQEMIDAFS